MEIKPRASKIFRSSETADGKRQESFMTSSIESNKAFFRGKSGINSVNVTNTQRNTDTDDRCQVATSDSIASSPSKSNTIFNKVTNSFSGLFSNAAWSEWLKRPLASSFNEEEEAEEEDEDEEEEEEEEAEAEAEAEAEEEEVVVVTFRDKMPDISPASVSSSSSSSSRSKSFKELYPEEGVADNNMIPGEPSLSTSNAAETCMDDALLPTLTDLCSFKTGLSLISSMPLSSCSVRKKAPEDFLCESVIVKPSTSKLPSEILTPKEDSSYSSLLRKSPTDLEAERFTQSNGAFSRCPTTRKRLKENGEEECVDEGDDCGRGKKRGRLLVPSPHQIFSEGAQEEGLEPTQRRKRPRFSISAYGSPLNNQQGAHEEEECPQPFSIFYPGRIAFGGASNHCRRRFRIAPRKVLPRSAVVSTPTDDDGLDEGLSSVARRILHCIDKISTPLSASKRALPFTTPRDMSLDTSTFVADFHKHRPTLKVKNSFPPVSKLLTPSKVKVRKNISSILEPKDVSSLTSKGESWDWGTQGRKCGLEALTSSASFASPAQALKMDSAPVSSQSISKSFVVEARLPLVMESEKRFEQKSSYGSQPSDSSESKGHTVSEHDQKNVEKKQHGFPFSWNAVTDPFRHPAEDELEQYQFCEPEVVSNFSCVESLPPTTMYEEAEFKFSPPFNEAKKSAASHTSNSVSEGRSVVGSGNWEDIFKPAKGIWECNVCLLQNDESKTTCVACHTAKPSSTSCAQTPSGNSLATVSSSKSWSTHPLTGSTVNSMGSWGEAFIAPEGSWECGSCLLQNKAEISSCVACMAPKSQEKSKRPSCGWGDSFKPPSGSWDCEVCFLQNKSSATKCAACETAKPSQKEQVTTSSVLPPQKTSSKDLSQKKGSVNCWGDAFKPSKGAWECAVCLLQNDKKASTCVACMSAKPKDSSTSDAEAGQGLPKGGFPPPFEGGLSKDDTSGRFAQDVFKASNNSWVCPECILTNQSLEDKCIGCKGSRPDITNDSRSSSRCQPSTGLKTFASEFSRNYEGWSCDTCLTWNKIVLQKCASCQAPRIPLSPAIVSEALTGNFKFGAKPQPSKESTQHSAIPPFSSSQPSFSFVSQASSTSQGSAVKMKTVFSSGEAKFTWSSAPSPATTAATSPTSIFGNNTFLSFFKAPSKDGAQEKKDDSSNPVPKPLFQFPSVAAAPSTAQALEQAPSAAIPKLEFPKSENKTPSAAVFPFGSKEPSQSASKSTILSTPPTFNFFGSDRKTPSFTPFNPPSNFATSITENQDKAATIVTTTSTSATTTTSAAPATSSASTVNLSFTSNPQSPNLTFAFGQPNSKPLNTGFNFGQATAKPSATSFNFGSSTVFQFGQTQSANLTSVKPAGPAPPSFLNIDIPKANPFNVASSGGGPQRRTFKKAFRRNK